MIYQAEHTAFLLNEAYTFKSVRGKNSSFLQSVSEMPFYFRSCALASRDNLCVHAGGQINYNMPVSFRQSNLPYTVLFIITSGSGAFSIEEQGFSVCANDFILIPPETCLSFKTARTPFAYDVFYLSGCVVNDFLAALCTDSKYFYRGITQIDNTIRRLLPSMLAMLPSDTDDAALHLSTLFHLAFSAMLDAQRKEDAALNFPAHVRQMLQIFDTDYALPHSLEDLEQELGINKYRLCRDFSAHVGCSPIQYLNQVRLREARHLLRTTDLTIREVGSAIGIDNTTHFINLFKKNAGITPLQFRHNHKL